MTSTFFFLYFNGVYCQVTQLEQQGGPEIQRDKVRDRAQVAYEGALVGRDEVDV